jgi:hypothetical protein
MTSPNPFAWYDRALCKEVGQDLFFTDEPDEGPKDSETSKRSAAAASGHQTQSARRVCSMCPVWLECRIMGLAEPYGVWGGLTAADRQRIRNDLGMTTKADHNGPTLDEVRAEFTARWKRAEGDPQRFLEEWPEIALEPIWQSVTVRESRKRLGPDWTSEQIKEDRL